jgi:hypothetical protein
MKRKTIQNVFSDISSLVFRALLSDPEKKWTLQGLSQNEVSLGLVSEVLNKAETLGYVERVSKGPASFTRLIRKDTLLKEWLNAYQFERNQQAYYLYTGKNFLKESHYYLDLKKITHAYTLYSASRLISPYVKDDRHFIYLDMDREKFPDVLKDLKTQLSLYQLVKGGNVCFVLPYYRNAVFKDLQKIKGYPVISNLQLYLDLMSFPPSGVEEAGHLADHFKRKGESFV